MAVVYLARQPALDREVALKELDLDIDEPTVAQRFVREARVAAALDHPNVVTLFDFFEHDGVPYIAMEYVSGGSLRPLVGRLTLPQVFGVLEGVLAGLGHAERRGIAHRDLKPENLLIGRSGGVKIADFGIARAYNALTGKLTSTGGAIGTPAYMAPEQALDGPLGPYTDIYAAGVIAYELLAGRPPFEPGNAPMAALYCHVHKPPPALAGIAPSTPPSVRTWVEWLLAKAPSARPASAARAWEALEEIAVAELGPYWRREAAITPREAYAEPEAPPTRVQPTERPPPAGRARGPAGPRRRLVVGVSVVAAVGAGVAATLIATGSEPPPRAATPFDFDGDGRQELVLGMPGSAASGGEPTGVVVVHRGDRRTPPTVITPAAAGVPGPHDEADAFGASVASADFDGDGRADLAIGMPGRDQVVLLYGTDAALLDGRRDTIEQRRLPLGAARYGSRLVAGDFSGDGFDDLAVGAPGTESGQPATGSIQLVLGHADGLRPTGARTIRRPSEEYAEFGSAMRAGDVDGDGHLDLVEGATDRPGSPGHATFCRGSAEGPAGCEALEGGASSLAVGDVNGDGYADIVQGDHIEASVPSGLVRIWAGGEDGPASEPLLLTQSERSVVGEDEAGDGFGFSLDIVDFDADGFADMAIGAPGENGVGAVMVVRGGPEGWAQSGSSWFTRNSPRMPGEPEEGEGFGSRVAAWELPGDERPDLVIAARAARRLDDAITLLEADRALFAPGEARGWRLRLEAAVDDPAIDRIRIARMDGG